MDWLLYFCLFTWGFFRQNGVNVSHQPVSFNPGLFLKLVKLVNSRILQYPNENQEKINEINFCKKIRYMLLSNCYDWNYSCISLLEEMNIWESTLNAMLLIKIIEKGIQVQFRNRQHETCSAFPFVKLITVSEKVRPQSLITNIYIWYIVFGIESNAELRNSTTFSKFTPRHWIQQTWLFQHNFNNNNVS